MTGYQQLTQEQRYQIYALQKANFTLTQIASEIGVHKSTVSREVRRNRGGRGYRPKQAQELTTARKLAASTTRIATDTWSLVESRLRDEQWSPEQISGWLRLKQQPVVSHERIYQHIYADKRAGGTLYTHLRCQKQRRKRYGSYDRRGQLPNCRSIETRPAIVAAKTRVGDWEADTIIGKGHTGTIVTLTERRVETLADAAGRGQNGGWGRAGHDHALRRSGRPGAYHHVGQRTRVCSSSSHRRETRGGLLLRASLLVLGARLEREHQRADSPVLSQAV